MVIYGRSASVTRRFEEHQFNECRRCVPRMAVLNGRGGLPRKSRADGRLTALLRMIVMLSLPTIVLRCLFVLHSCACTWRVSPRVRVQRVGKAIQGTGTEAATLLRRLICTYP